MDPTQLIAFVTILTILVGLLGICAALHAAYCATKDKAEVQQLADALIPNEAWEGVYATDEPQLLEWLRKLHVRKQSHLETIFVSAWAGYYAKQGVDISLLHNLTTRREKARMDARLASGIAALLLVFGIVGTLLAVHSILVNTEINNPEAAKSLVSGLGKAFIPSLAALVFTILVVASRGIYSMKAHQLGYKLDWFIQTRIVPRFPVQTLSEQFREINGSLAELACRMSKRDVAFGTAINNLAETVHSLEPAIACLHTAAKHGEDASKNLHSRSESLSRVMQETFGAESPIVTSVGRLDRCVGNLESVYHETIKRLDKLSTVIDRVGQDTRSHSNDAKEAVVALAEVCASIPQEVADGLSKETKNLLASISGQTSEMNAIITSLKSSHADFVATTKQTADLADTFVKGADSDLRTCINSQEIRLQKLVEFQRKQIEDSQMALQKTCESIINSLKDSATELLAASNAQSSGSSNPVESALTAELVSLAAFLRTEIEKLNGARNQIDHVPSQRTVELAPSADVESVPGSISSVDVSTITNQRSEPKPVVLNPETVSEPISKKAVIPEPFSQPPKKTEAIAPAPRDPLHKASSFTERMGNWLSGNK
jgi:ABC-type transporter Mla subunit MlaD